MCRRERQKKNHKCSQEQEHEKQLDKLVEHLIKEVSRDDKGKSPQKGNNLERDCECNHRMHLLKNIRHEYS